MDVHHNIRKMRIIEAEHDCLCLKYVDCKRSIAGGYMNGSVMLFNAKTHKKELILADDDTNSINNAVTCVASDNRYNNIIISTYSGGLVKLWDFLTGHCMHTIKEKRQTYGAVYHPKRPKCFTFGDDGRIFLYDVETSTKEFVYQKSERMVLDGHVSKIFCLRFNPVLVNEFVTAGWDRTLYYWDVRVQHSIRHISDIFMGGDGLLINKDGTDLITCEWKRDDPLKIWDYKTGQLIQILQPDMEKCQLYCGKYLDDKIIAIGGSDNNMLRFVNLKTNMTVSYVKGLPAGVYCMDTSLEGKKSVIKYDECSDLPVISFCSGKCIYEVKFRVS